MINEVQELSLTVPNTIGVLVLVFFRRGWFSVSVGAVGTDRGRQFSEV